MSAYGLSPATMATDGDSMTVYLVPTWTFDELWQKRIAHLDLVASSGIPCSLWGWEAVHFYGVPIV
jgi:hypothetical protein